jgi:5-methylcytosine-specific restriction endonuclease McrA
MDTVILAAGRGARLEGVAAPFWKPLVAVGGRPLVVRLADQARRLNEGRTVIVTSPENTLPIVQVLDANELLPNVDVIVQPSPDGPGAAFLRARPFLSGPSMILAADNVIADEDILSCHGHNFVIGTQTVKTKRRAARFTVIGEDRTVGENLSAPDLSAKKWADGKWRVWLGPLVCDPTVLGTAILSIPWKDERKIGRALDLVGDPFLAEVNCQDVGTPLNMYYREVFFAYNGPGPYECCFCRKLVTMEEVHIHHIDHDHDNGDPTNLAPAHDPCHIKHHAAPKGPHSPERRSNISKALVGKPGRPKSEESKRKIKEAKLREPR